MAGVDGLEGLIAEVREARLQVAHVRAQTAVERYPEIEVDAVVPLPDGKIIREALRRELGHQRQVLKNMQRDQDG